MPVFHLKFKVTAEKNTSIIFWQNIEFYKIHTVIVLLSSCQLNYQHKCYLYIIYEKQQSWNFHKKLHLNTL